VKRKTEAHYSVRVPYELAVEIFGSEERLRHGVSRTRASNWRRDGVPASVVLGPLMERYRRKDLNASAGRRDRRFTKCDRCIRLIRELAEKGEWDKIDAIELMTKKK